VTLLAAHAQEALLEPPALQVSLELLLNESWKRPASLSAQFAKRGIVLLDELIQQRRPGSVPAIGGARGRRARATTDMAGVPATGGDATDYDATRRQ
jgi:hypothetical protein